MWVSHILPLTSVLLDDQPGSRAEFHELSSQRSRREKGAGSSCSCGFRPQSRRALARDFTAENWKRLQTTWSGPRDAHLKVGSRETML